MSEPQLTPGGMRRKPRQARSQERVARILDAAEDLFASHGYAPTTTNAIAARAQVSIGSLYQFFPDKPAILQALALRYAEKLHRELAIIDDFEHGTLPLPGYVNTLIAITECFSAANLCCCAIFMEVRRTLGELEAIDEAIDTRLIQDLVTALVKRDTRLELVDRRAIAFVLVKMVGSLLWISLRQAHAFRQHVLIETTRPT